MLTEDDRRLWRHVIRDVVPLAPFVEAEQEAGPPLIEPDPPPPPPAPPRFFAMQTQPPALAAGAMIGVDRATSERLRRGRLSVDARLDLHGMTQDQAHLTISRFIADKRDEGARCVIVITGKGARDPEGRHRGILKDAVPRWLNEPRNRQHIVAFTEAQPKDGGSGALYVLLKRKRD